MPLSTATRSVPGALRSAALLLGAALALAPAGAAAQNAAKVTSPRAAPDLDDDEDEDESEATGEGTPEAKPGLPAGANKPAGDKSAADKPAAPSTAPAAAPDVSKRVSKLYKKFRALKEQLPFKIGAGFWLYYWQPLSRDAALAAGSLDPFIEMWALHLEIDKEWKGLGAHVELRFRDGHRLGDGGGSGFGAASTSNVWFQEAYAYYGYSGAQASITVKLGKTYKKNGLTWDNSFFGDLLFYDGFMLNPDWGATAEGVVHTADDKFSLEWSLQYLAVSDGVQGSYTWGRTSGLPPWANPTDVTSLRTFNPAPESEVDSTGAPLATISNVLLARLLATAKLGSVGLNVGASAETGTVSRYSEFDGIDDPGQRYTRFEGDFELDLKAGRFAATILGEVLRQRGPGVRDANYFVGGLRMGYGPVALHVDGSYVRYQMQPTIDELMVTAGASFEAGGGLTLYLDYDEWRRQDPHFGTEPNEFSLYDRSLMLSIDYSY